jgi:ribosomal protein L29
MTKKISYNTKTQEELAADLSKLRASVTDNARKIRQGKGLKEYRTDRKNLARVLTALNAKRSTNA